MAALSGNALLQKLEVGGKCRYIAKNGTDIFKAEVLEIFEGKTKNKKGLNGVNLKPIEGPHKDGEYFIAVERLKGMQGRQPGYSPAKKDSPAESPAPKQTRGKAETSKDKKNTKKKEEKENYDIAAMIEELKDMRQRQEDAIEEAKDDIERIDSMVAFLENVEIDSGDGDDTAEDEAEEEAEASPEPEKPSRSSRNSSKRTSGSRGRRGMDEDEA